MCVCVCVCSHKNVFILPEKDSMEKKVILSVWRAGSM